ncbi:arginase [Tepidibacillus infernus]|uniref:Arginase n=1 Tax=Tepidibacillus decaturensis TaxID=1413211 RepID=A0A135L0L2_9BACI|nr:MULTISPECIES: arginase [Tepidibacillus]KXG42516.1 arginase [Tepidibacillus decaturensis]GBF11875.1 arginase [Tepidibacillus sp. HK-1]
MNKDITIIGVPLDLGAGRRGVDMGPSAIRYANVKDRLEKSGYHVLDLGNLNVPTPETYKIENQKLKYLKEVTAINKILAEQVSKIMQKGRFPLVLGGDHSIAIGTIAGVSKHKKNLGVIWFDAHGDINTPETSPSGNIHGMPLAVSLGEGHPDLTQILNFSPKIKSENIVLIGARDLDKGERNFIKERGIRVYTMHEIDRLGMAQVVEEAIYYVTKNTDGVHLSLDLDGLDPNDAPGVGTPVTGGITYREGHLAMEMIAEANILISAEFVEVNPILDERNKTAHIAVGLMASALGEKLL